MKYPMPAVIAKATGTVIPTAMPTAFTGFGAISPVVVFAAGYGAGGGVGVGAGGGGITMLLGSKLGHSCSMSLL